MIVRNITKKDKLQTMKVSSICFEYPFSTNNLSEDEFLENIYSSPKEKLHKNWECQLAAFDEDNEFMACMAAIPFDFYFEGKCFSGNGIGNVCTYPQHRQKGAIRGMFEKMLTDSYRNEQVLSYLYPFSESFYGKFGYHRTAHSKFYEFRLLGFPDSKYDGTFHLLTQENTSLFSDFKTAYNNFASNYNMMINRDEHDWANITDANAHMNNNYAYLYKDKNGIPKGYLVFKRDGRTLRCRELIFADFETLKAIFSFVKTYSTDYDTFRCHIPANIHMEHFCTDFSRFAADMKVVSNGVVRVINAKVVLENAKYIGSGTISLKIIDPWIPENNGLFTVIFQDGIAQKVTFLPLEDASVLPHDVELPISLFSAAIVGNYDVADFDYVEGIQINTSCEKLKQIFYKKNCFINNYF